MKIKKTIGYAKGLQRIASETIHALVSANSRTPSHSKLDSAESIIDFIEKDCMTVEITMNGAYPNAYHFTFVDIACTQRFDDWSQNNTESLCKFIDAFRYNYHVLDCDGVSLNYDRTETTFRLRGDEFAAVIKGFTPNSSHYDDESEYCEVAEVA